jgi:hypothetical protein
MGAEVLGRGVDIPRIVAQYGVGIILFAIHNITSPGRQHLLDICGSTPTQTWMVPDILGTLDTIVSDKRKYGQVMNRPVDRQQAETLRAAGIPPALVQVWLNDLERSAQRGDIVQVRAQILSLRTKLDTGLREWSIGSTQ